MRLEHSFRVQTSSSGNLCTTTTCKSSPSICSSCSFWQRSSTFEASRSSLATRIFESLQLVVNLETCYTTGSLAASSTLVLPSRSLERLTSSNSLSYEQVLWHGSSTTSPSAHTSTRPTGLSRTASSSSPDSRPCMCSTPSGWNLPS